MLSNLQDGRALAFGLEGQEICTCPSGSAHSITIRSMKVPSQVPSTLTRGPMPILCEAHSARHGGAILRRDRRGTPDNNLSVALGGFRSPRRLILLCQIDEFVR